MTMTQTQLAKILVFVHLVLSLVFATWAWAVYNQHVDWGKKAATADRPAGELAKRLEEIDRLGGGSKEGSRQRAEARWVRAHKELQALEAIRRENQRWYDQQLELMLTGMAGGKPISPAVHTLLYDQNGLLVDPKTGRPQLRVVADRAGQPVPALQILDRQSQETNNQIKATMQTIAGLIQQERDLTVAVNGEGTRKGLRQNLVDEQTETDKSVGEQEYLKPLLYNREAEAQLLLQRQKALQERVKELERLASRAP